MALTVVNFIRAGFEKEAVSYSYNAEGTIYTTCYLNADGDGYSNGTSEQVEETCSENYYTIAQLMTTSGDCDDFTAAINPGAADPACDGIDQDCSGADAR